MKAHTDRFDFWLRVAVLLSIIVILYTGPASAIGLDQIFEDDYFGESSFSELLLWAGFVWLFSIPLILAHRWWDTNPAGSTTALGIFFIMMMIIWMLFGRVGVGLLGLALAAPLELWTEDGATPDDLHVTAVVISAVVCIVIPVAAMAFQFSRIDDWDKLRR